MFLQRLKEIVSKKWNFIHTLIFSLLLIGPILVIQVFWSRLGNSPIPVTIFSVLTLTIPVALTIGFWLATFLFGLKQNKTWYMLIAIALSIISAMSIITAIIG